jgi:hypothetical protein
MKTLLNRAVRVAMLVATSATVFTASSGPASAADKTSLERHAYFGDLHLHTTYSFDAYVLLGAKIDPDQAYKFARGEAVPYLGGTIRRSTPPLDFLAVTDHSENIGVFNTLEDPNSPLSRSEVGEEVRKSGGAKAFGKIVQLMTTGHPLPGVDVSATTHSAWQREIEFANRNYQPGKFTTFIAYEWSSMPDGQNLHRNVIFRGNTAPHPFSSVDSNKPEELWAWLDNIRRQGYEALAIPHNSNASNGLMFDWVDSHGKPIDQAYAEERASNEPLAEISQNKGASETLPELSPNDEFANFERYDHLLVSPIKSKPGGSYVRDALGRGLIIAPRAGGVNPFKYGIVGASDYHNGLSDSAEDAYGGGAGATDPTQPPPDPQEVIEKLGDVRSQLSKLVKLPPGTTPPPEPSPLTSYYETGSGNLTGVWAEENTRESIYDALRRKETFATSGTRLKVRFFGGWQLQANPNQDRDWVHKAYASGVPQGGDLPSQGKGAPQFALWAVKDPNGANLDRIQVIKLTAKDGQYVERIYDVAVSDHRKIDPVTHRAPALASTVDLKTARYTNTVGAAELASTWRDPQFDASLPAVYYVRVLEISTPRWSTISAVKRAAALPTDFPPTIQERAWTSPIWYTPK